jgi:uncharacterized protein HemY
MSRTGPTHLDVSQVTAVIMLVVVVAVVVMFVLIVRRGMK